jgi:RNA-binding protein PNO1
MVVVHAQPSTSTGPSPHRKNRRRTNKKHIHPDNTTQNADDQEMSTDLPEGDEPSTRAAGVTPTADNDDELMIDEGSMVTADSTAPIFPALPEGAVKSVTKKSETRRVPVPPHRMTPLKKDWVNIFGPLTEILGLQVRMNVQRRCVEIRTSKHTKDIGSLQKGADFVKAFTLGFDVNVSSFSFVGLIGTRH